MKREYDVFEKLPDGSLMWRATVIGHEQALEKLQELARQSLNEFQVHHLPSKALIATINEQKGSG